MKETMEDWNIWYVILRLGVVVVAVYVVYQVLLAQRMDFVIQLRKGRVKCKGKIPLSQHQAVEEFLLQDLSLNEPVKISGARNGQRLNLWFRGRLTEGDKQRIRNFLLTRL